MQSWPIIPAMISPAQFHSDDVILAAGGLIMRETASGDEVMIVHRRRYDDWTFPKGKLKAEDARSFQAAAVREVEEETGCLCKLDEYLGALSYQVQGIPKVVLFWQMTVLRQSAIQDLEESQGVQWLSIREAQERLTYEQEKAFLGRLKGMPEEVAAPQKGQNRYSWGNRWFYGKLERDRLARESDVFSVELEFLERRDLSADQAWAAVAHRHLSNAREYLNRGNTESGWVCLHAAQRCAVFGLDEKELVIRAAILRHETERKLSGWRADAVKDLLNGNDITAKQMFDAMAIRDEFFSNQYYKIWLTKDQLRVLMAVCLPAFLALLLISLFSPHTFSQFTLEDAWRFPALLAVLIFGLLGAAFSIAQSLMNDSRAARIPERVADHFVTLTRLLSGAIVGLASYTFFVSKAFTIKGLENSAIAAFTIAFIFGYTGERLVARVAGSTASDKPKS
jgi:8-oxo-dGTP pyrophosphatase MutT (NUDIX family)